MKNDSKPHWIVGGLILFFSTVTIMSSSFCCSGGSFGSGTTGGLQLDTLLVNNCLRKAALKKDLALSEVRLKYNFAKYRNYAEELRLDFEEMATIHPDMIGLITEARYTGEIHFLENILFFRDNVSDDFRKPLIQVDFKDVECEHVTYEQPLITITDYSQVSGNILRDVPAYNSMLAFLKITVKSVQTKNHNLQVVWDYYKTQVNLGSIIVSENGNPSSDLDNMLVFNMEGTITSSIGDNEIATRKNKKTGETEIVEIGDAITIDDSYNYPKDDEISPLTPSLEGAVYSGGELDEGKKWDAPKVYKP